MPGLTCQAISGGPKARTDDRCWLPPSRKPGVRQERKMVGCLVKAATLLVMKNHFYSFGNVIRKQRMGGAIGNSLTEKLGRLLMKRFDKKFKALLKKLKIELELYERYVDDVTEAMVALDPGVRFDEQKRKMIRVKELEEEDQNVAADRRTMEEMRKIGDS